MKNHLRNHVVIRVNNFFLIHLFQSVAFKVGQFRSRYYVAETILNPTLKYHKVPKRSNASCKNCLVSLCNIYNGSGNGNIL